MVGPLTTTIEYLPLTSLNFFLTTVAPSDPPAVNTTSKSFVSVASGTSWHRYRYVVVVSHSYIGSTSPVKGDEHCLNHHFAECK